MKSNSEHPLQFELENLQNLSRLMRHMDFENIFNPKKKDTSLVLFPSIIGLFKKNKTNKKIEDVGTFLDSLKCLGFLLYLYKFQTKQGFTPRNSIKFCYIPWKF